MLFHSIANMAVQPEHVGVSCSLQSVVCIALSNAVFHFKMLCEAGWKVKVLWWFVFFLKAL